MTASSDRYRECDYPYCADEGLRHLMGGHFCGTHRQRIINERPEDLHDYVRKLKASGGGNVRAKGTGRSQPGGGPE